MSHPTWMLYLDNDAVASERLEQACRLARRFESHLIGLSCHRVQAWPDIGPAAMLGSDPLTVELHEAAHAASLREEFFLQPCDAHGLRSFELALDERGPLDAIARAAACADLVLMGQPDPADGAFAQRHALASDVLLHSARPTLIVPYVGNFDDLGASVLIAWDGSHGAARAATDALPMLRRARSVRLACIDRSEPTSGSVGREDADRAVAWLARQGVKAEPAFTADTGSVGDVLLSQVADIGADLLVMGAWGRSRFAERVMGGATRTVLQSMTVPVLFSH